MKVVSKLSKFGLLTIALRTLVNVTLKQYGIKAKQYGITAENLSQEKKKKNPILQQGMGENGKYKPVKEETKVLCSSNQSSLIRGCSLICDFFWAFFTLREYSMTYSKASEKFLLKEQILYSNEL